MNRLLLCLMPALSAALTTKAQVLPVPNTRNPDWILENTKPGSQPSGPDTLPRSRDRMPIANPEARRSGTDTRMPNALPKSLSSIGNTQRYWDAERQLQYEWQARPGHASPDSIVTVRQQKTGAVYVFRKRSTAKNLATPRLLGPSK